jgi:hypothetical protein
MNSNDSQQPLDDNARKLLLKSLFADDPFLSPTMKARCLHEKLQEMRARETVPEERIQERRAEPDRLFWIEGQDEPASLRPGRKPESEVRISFEEATECLRRTVFPTPYANTAPDRLNHFRTQVLPQWLQKVPRRETGQHIVAGQPVPTLLYNPSRGAEEKE